MLSRAGAHRDNRETWSPQHETHLQAVREQDPPPARTPAVRLLLRQLSHAPGPQLARFMDRDIDIDGLPARVVELTGTAGDVVICHPCVLHSPSANIADRPRIMRASRIYRRFVAS